eukprot:9498337-Pyramimonas_sp.AAC.2
MGDWGQACTSGTLNVYPRSFPSIAAPSKMKPLSHAPLHCVISVRVPPPPLMRAGASRTMRRDCH